MDANQNAFLKRYTRRVKKSNSEIYRELNKLPLLDYLQNDRHNSTTHQQCMDRCRIRTEMKKYRLMEKDP